MIVLAGEEGAQVDRQLAACQAELAQQASEAREAQCQLAACKEALALALTERDGLLHQLASATLERDDAMAKAAALREELEQTRRRLEVLSQKGHDLEPELAASFQQKLRDAEVEIALQNAEVNNRGAVITALENALEEQNTSLRTLEERFLAYAEQVQALQIQRLSTPSVARGLANEIL